MQLTVLKLWRFDALKHEFIFWVWCRKVVPLSIFTYVHILRLAYIEYILLPFFGEQMLFDANIVNQLQRRIL
jgi:hypothetical protein